MHDFSVVDETAAHSALVGAGHKADVRKDDHTEADHVTEAEATVVAADAVATVL